MNYTLNQLQIFLKVVQTESVTRAAEELNLTQPAVSIQLRNLQAQFDIPLTEIIGRKLYITDFGKEIAEAAENILNQIHAINYRTSAHKGQLGGRLKFSVVSTGKYVLPYFLTRFLKKHPEVELIMDVTNKARVIESLDRNEVDYALVSIIPDELAVNKLDLLENKLFLVGSKEIKLHKDETTREIFQRMPLIYREDGSGTRQVMERFIDRHAIKVKRKLQLTSNEAVKQAVLAGLGVSIMPMIGIKNEVAAGDMKIIPAKGLPIRTMWQLIWLKGKNLSPIATAFGDHIRSEKESIVQRYFHNL